MLSILSVAEVSRYLKEVLDSDDLLRDVWVSGEVSNFTQSQNGHLYFTLKDETAQIRCGIFRSQAASLAFRPQNALAVVVHGRISFYEAGGNLQLYGDAVLPRGVGALYLRFEQLRGKLEREGLFDPARKRPLPSFPRRIALVTSPKGAVMHDVINVISRRYPAVEIVLVPVPVQGDGAAAQIAEGLRDAARLDGVDVVILARGGGSLEDLWCFNEEEVARAIFASPVPVVTGIGHQTDVTIADMVADLRAPTPSAAAELVVPDRLELKAEIQRRVVQAQMAARGMVEEARFAIQQAEDSLARLIRSPRLLYWRQRVDDLDLRARQAIVHAISLRRERLQSLTLQAQALSPSAVLGRGYSICWNVDRGAVVHSVEGVRPGEALEIHVADGAFAATAAEHVLRQRRGPEPTGAMEVR